MPVIFYKYDNSTPDEQEKLGEVLEQIVELCRVYNMTITADVQIAISDDPNEHIDSKDFEIKADGSIRRGNNGFPIASSITDIVTHAETRNKRTGGWGKKD